MADNQNIMCKFAAISKMNLIENDIYLNRIKSKKVTLSLIIL